VDHHDRRLASEAFTRGSERREDDGRAGRQEHGDHHSTRRRCSDPPCDEAGDGSHDILQGHRRGANKRRVRLCLFLRNGTKTDAGVRLTAGCAVTSNDDARRGSTEYRMTTYRGLVHADKTTQRSCFASRVAASHA